MSNKRVIGGFALTALSFAFSGGNAFAQSTGSQDFEEIVVTAKRTAPVAGAVIMRETAPKSRASIGQEFIETQAAGQSALQLINLMPGVNFTNNDAYGSSGGNLRMRSFDGNRISLTFDGMPLNDTGNYAIFSNQLLDAELLGAVQVNMGSTDVDSPTASATGGTVNYTLRKPSETLDWAGSFAGGQEEYKRFFGAVDSGAVGPWGTNFLLSTSYQDYAKWRGLGDLEKRQYNGRVYQPLGENGDFVAVAFHYNENRNNNFRALTMADYVNPARGREFDFDGTCTVPTPVAGTSQSQADCANFYGRQINPSNTGNIRGSSRFTVSDAFTLTIDPSFQYVLANGGSQYGRVWENGVANATDGASRAIIGNTGVGRDLNGDGDTLDRVGLFTPSTTNTRRYGLTSSLIWDVTEGQRFRLAYTYDYGRHRQTGEYTFLNDDGTTTNIFGGKDGWGQRVFNADGYHLRARDRFSIAELNQVALEYRGEFLEDKLTIAAGVRAPFFDRELNQNCFTEVNSSNVLCTSLVGRATSGNLVRFDFNKDGDVADSGETTEYLRPYTRKHKYDEVLPNIGVSYELSDSTQIFASYIEGLSAPRTDQLYTEDFNNVKPETTQTVDVGLRYNGGRTSASVAAFTNKYKDRIQTAFDDTTGSSLDRSIGDVDVWGIEAALGVTPLENLDVFFSATYLKSELQDNIRTGRGTDGIFGTADDPFLPTAGKELVETPEWTLAGRIAYSIGAVQFGLDTKWVDERFATDVNDEVVSGYTVFGFDATIDMEKAVGLKGVSVQLNGTNIFDEDYLGSISSRTNALAAATSPATAASAPTYQPGAPQTFQLQIRKSF